MKRLFVPLLLLSILAGDTFGLSATSRRKSYVDGEIFYTADYHADLDFYVTHINALNAKFPGTSPNDSLKISLTVTDTLLARTIGKLVFKSYLTGVNSSDSLVFDWARLDTAHGDTLQYGKIRGGQAYLDSLVNNSSGATFVHDTLYVVDLRIAFSDGGSTSTFIKGLDYLDADTTKVDAQLWVGMTAPIVGFSGATTAGTRLNFGSLVRADSVWMGTSIPIAGFTSGTTAGTRVNYGSLVRADSVWNGTTIPVVGFSSGSTAGVRELRAYVKLDTAVVSIADINGGAIDGTVIGASTAAAGSFTRVGGSLAAAFTGGLTTNTLRVTGAINLSALRDTVRAITDTASGDTAASKYVSRDVAGRIQAANPSAAWDVTNKAWVEANAGGLGDWVFVGTWRIASGCTQILLDTDSYTAQEFLIAAVQGDGATPVEADWTVGPTYAPARAATAGLYDDTAANFRTTAGGTVIIQGGDIPGEQTYANVFSLDAATGVIQLEGATEEIRFYANGAIYDAAIWYR